MPDLATAPSRPFDGPQRVGPTQAAAIAVTGLAVAYFVLWACAPMAALPPMTTMDADHRNDFGVAASYARANRPARFLEGTTSQGVGGLAWYQHRAGPIDFGAMVHGGNFTGGGAGGFVRWRYLDRPTLRAGAQLDGGLFWTMLSVPVAFQVDPNVWLYASPGYGFAVAPYRLPVGASIRISDAMFVHFEGMVSGGNPECLGSNRNCGAGEAFRGPAVLSGTVGFSVAP